eukprot:1815162-Prymnesium_polylepis.1
MTTNALHRQARRRHGVRRRLLTQNGSWPGSTRRGAGGTHSTSPCISHACRIVRRRRRTSMVDPSDDVGEGGPTATD